LSNQASRPYKATGKITVLGIKLEDKRFCSEWQQAFPVEMAIKNT
jgi:hypothetical protein